jgi:hypothetical protein
LHFYTFKINKAINSEKLKMIDTVLRVFGGQYDVNALLAEFCQGLQAESFIQGEPDLFGNPNVDSGFDVLVSENPAPESNVNDIRFFLKNNSILFGKLKVAGATCIIDVAYSVAGTDQDAPSLCLPVDVLGLCYERNVAVELTVFPAMDLEE